MHLFFQINNTIYCKTNSRFPLLSTSIGSVRKCQSYSIDQLHNVSTLLTVSYYHKLLSQELRILIAPAYILRFENIMASNPLTKVPRQHESTWTSLQRRVSGMHYSYSSLFPENVFPLFSKIKQSPLAARLDIWPQHFSPRLRLFWRRTKQLFKQAQTRNNYQTSSPCLSAIQEQASQLRLITLQLRPFCL